MNCTVHTQIYNIGMSFSAHFFPFFPSKFKLDNAEIKLFIIKISNSFFLKIKIESIVKTKNNQEYEKYSIVQTDMYQTLKQNN